MTNWANWDGSQRCEGVEWRQPATVEELQAIVVYARTRGKVVRAVGAGHSWSEVVPQDGGVLVNLDLLARATSVDAAARTAEFEAGIRLREIGPFLEEAGLAMENLGAITAQSLAGAIGTGTHGTGLSYGILGTQMTACSLVDGTGQVRRYSDPESLRALRLNLGVLGILVSVELRCVDAHRVELDQFRITFDEMVARYGELTANERCRIYWFPGTDEVFVNTMNRTDKPDDAGPVFSWIEAQLLRKRLMGFLWSVGRNWPDFVDELNAFQIAVGFRDQKPIVGPSYEAITTPIPPFHKECEIAVPLAAGPQVLEELRQRVSAEGLQINVPSEIRFVRGDDILLSPSSIGDACYIGAYTASDRDAESYFAIAEQLAEEFHGRTHWGKIGAPDRAKATEWYPGFGEFERLRAQLDPDRVFLNPYLGGVFSGAEV